MIFVDVKAVVENTVIGYTGTHNFAQAVYIVSRNIPFAFQFPAHIFRPGFSTEHSHPQFHIRCRVAEFSHCISQMQGIRRRTGQYCRTKIGHQLQLTAGIAA